MRLNLRWLFSEAVPWSQCLPQGDLQYQLRHSQGPTLGQIWPQTFPSLCCLWLLPGQVTLLLLSPQRVLLSSCDPEALLCSTTELLHTKLVTKSVQVSFFLTKNHNFILVNGQNQLHNLRWGALQNENAGTLVQKLVRILT